MAELDYEAQHGQPSEPTIRCHACERVLDDYLYVQAVSKEDSSDGLEHVYCPSFGVPSAVIPNAIEILLRAYLIKN